MNNSSVITTDDLHNAYFYKMIGDYHPLSERIEYIRDMVKSVVTPVPRALWDRIDDKTIRYIDIEDGKVSLWEQDKKIFITIDHSESNYFVTLCIENYGNVLCGRILSLRAPYAITELMLVRMKRAWGKILSLI